MKPFPIPVVPMVGPGSQPEEEVAHYLSPGSDMAVFRPPIPRPASSPEVLARARAVLESFLADMQATPFGDDSPPRLSLLDEAPEVVDEINELLGQGEVSVIARSPRSLEVQETAFAAVWRIRVRGDDGSLLRDEIEATPMPRVVHDALALSEKSDMSIPPAPAGLMNAPALLNELLEHSARTKPGTAAHVINLTLLPVTPEDLAYLADALGFGTLSILSRGYGNCRITATQLPHTWWVQYFNSMDQLILNTIEVVDIPEVALAAQEDYEDSTTRLGEWLVTVEE